MSAKPIIAKLVFLALAALVAGCGDEPESAPTTTVVVAPPAAEAPTEETTTGEVPPPPAGGGSGTGPAETAEFDPRINAVERAAARTVREYVAALDARDGAAACGVLAPGALDDLKLPEPAGECATSLEASIGYRDPRGLPVWESARVAAVRSIELTDDGNGAKVVATVVTTFADRDEQSVEDDVVYLVRDREAWLVAKPSATLYRAVGIADVPPSVLSPPN